MSIDAEGPMEVAGGGIHDAEGVSPGLVSGSSAQTVPPASARAVTTTGRCGALS